MVKCVFFDLDDTLYNYSLLNERATQSVILAVAEKYGVTDTEAEDAFLTGRQETKKNMPDCAAQHNRLLYCQKMLEHLGKNPVTDAGYFYGIYWDTILDNMFLNDGAKELIQKLKENKIMFGICTDLTADIQHRKIIRLGLDKYMDYLVTSEEAGWEKPNKAIFKLCITKSGFQPEEIVYIGDSLKKDVEGAIDAGMKAVWYNPSGKEGGSENGNFITVNSFRELLERNF